MLLEFHWTWNLGELKGKNRIIKLTQMLSPADCLHWSARTCAPIRRSARAVPRLSAGRVHRSNNRTWTDDEQSIDKISRLTINKNKFVISRQLPRTPRLSGTSMHEFHSTTRGLRFCISCTPLPAVIVAVVVDGSSIANGSHTDVQ